MNPDRRHKLSFHLFGVFLMLGTAALAYACSFWIHQLWHALDDFGRGMFGGFVGGMVASWMIRTMNAEVKKGAKANANDHD